VAVAVGYFFETGLEGWIDGGSDCTRFNNSTRAYEGSYSIRIRDNSNSSNAVSPTLDLSGNSQVTIEFHTYSRGMEFGEDFFVEFWNGSSYQVIGNYARGIDFNNNAFFTDTIILDSDTYNFNANNKFRFRNDASVNNDQIYFDAVIISGDNVSAAPIVPNANDTVGSRAISFARNSDQNIKLYPNPTNSVLNIDILDGTYDEISIFSTTGKLVKKVEPNGNNLTIDVSQFATGMYFVRFVSNGLAVTKRFIKE